MDEIALVVSLQDQEACTYCSLLKFILRGGQEEIIKKLTFCIVSNTVLDKNISVFTQLLKINDVISTKVYLPLYSNSKFWPGDRKYSVNEKCICIKSQYNTRHKILSNCACKILLNTCSDYLLKMRWGKNLLTMTAWKWTEHSDVLLSRWPIFTN